MREIKYNIPVYEDEDIADLKEYSEKMAEAIKVQVDKFGNPLVFKGIVPTLTDLQAITEATNGDIYAVVQENKNYIWNGTAWEIYSNNLINQTSGGGTIINSSNVDVATATLSEDLTFSTSQAWEKFKINFDKISNTNFTLQDGGIKIGKGISKILISANIGFTEALSGTIRMDVRNNDVAVEKGALKQQTEDYFSISMIGQEIEVQEGDIISLTIAPSSAQANKTMRNFNTYMTIVAIQDGQSDILEDGIIVSPTEPETDRRKVWFQTKGKNLFDGKYNTGYGYNITTGEIEVNSGVYSSAEKIPIPVGATKICLSKNGESKTARFFFYDKDENYIGNNVSTSISNAIVATILENARYCHFQVGSAVINTDFSGIQLETGNDEDVIPTEFEEYINPTIYAKNKDGIYEKFIKKNVVNNNKTESTEDTYSCDYINSSLEIEQANDLLIVQNGYSFLDINIFKQGKHYFGDVVVKKNSGNFTNIQELVAKLSRTVKGVYNSGCFLTSNQYSVHDVGYCYIGGTNFYVADHKEKGYNYAKIHIDLVVN